MVISIILVLILGYIFGELFGKIKLPKIIGMIFIGIILGYFSILSNSFLEISSHFRKIALIIILMRAGLSIDFRKIKANGLAAILMCFIPALFEIMATTFFGPLLLPINYLEALLLGSVLAAVSPAIIVPRMIKFKEEYNSDAPNLMLAGSSIDDVFVLIVFYFVLGLFNSEGIEVLSIPLSIAIGVSVGCIVGILFRIILKKTNINVYVFLSLSFISIVFLSYLENYIEYNSLISVIIAGTFIVGTDKVDRVKIGYNKLWRIFEIFLFVLVGVTVNLEIAFTYGFQAISLLIIILLVRSIGVILCLLKSNFSIKEKFFCLIGYLPKATVQASIGAIALENNISSGGLILSIAVLSIVVTAPLGAILLDKKTPSLLDKKIDI